MSSTSARASTATAATDVINSMNGVLAAERFQRGTLLPPGAACETCYESDPLKLDANAAVVLCADHAAINGRRVERHHLAGKPWPIVLDVSCNWHRILTTLQQARSHA